MSLLISSEKIDNPLLLDLLRQLNHTFSRIGNDFFVIGATARDIILQILADTSARRKTRDLDIAIAVTDWDRYNEICKALIDDGFDKCMHQAQRFYYGDYEVDIVPYGAVAKADDNIYWPPEETTAMSVKGFDEVLRAAIPVIVNNEFEIRIASLHGLFLLKLNAWLDRNIGTNKDAEDMWYIVDNYYFANEQRAIHQEVYELECFDLTVGGAYWMAHDIADILGKDQLTFYRDILAKEAMFEEESRLVIQILETHRTLTSDDVIRVLNTITDVFSKRINDY